ncbi:tetratricopeptide repeat protein [Robertkochia flava]|uniref:tetratricopeptide repeat protein n=1 Tax=Robertkochia flava TaxID=3447986 RepID=UPI001CCD1D1F|nr:tetratricopeptide repeat protein [Robertkochia marina]
MFILILKETSLLSILYSLFSALASCNQQTKPPVRVALILKQTFLLSILYSLLSVFVSCNQQTKTPEQYPPFEEMVKPGDSLFLGGNFAGAVREYRKVIQAYPDSVSAYRSLTRSYLGIGMFDASRGILDKTEFGDDTLSTLSKYRRYAIWSIFKGDTTTLRKYTDSLLRYAFHTYPRPYLNAAFNEVFLKDYESAMAHLERYTVYGVPEHPPINMGFLYMKQGDTAAARVIFSEAESRLTQVLLETPADPDALFELAEIYTMKGDTAVAMEYLKRALKTGWGNEWWIYHIISDESVPDPVFQPLRQHPQFERIRDSLYKQRQLMKAEVMTE